MEISKDYKNYLNGLDTEGVNQEKLVLQNILLNNKEEKVQEEIKSKLDYVLSLTI